MHINKIITHNQTRRLLKALLKYALKISPKKCQLFRIELQYMENTIFIRDRRVYIMALQGRLEAIQKLKPPMTVKGGRIFVRMVNFISIFCPELQKLLKPIYDLTRKGRQFVWGKEQQLAFQEIKPRLMTAPVLHLPDSKGRFHLFQRLVNLLLAVLCTRFKMGNLN